MNEPDPDDRLESLVARCIVALEADGTGAVERILARNAGLAPQVRGRLDELRLRGLLTTAAPATDLLASFGPFEIVGRLGHGGMGTVYLAEQREPIRRRIALKVVRLGLDTDEVLARFGAEQQSLAIMNHENIARVFDAGTTPDGRAWFAMEYVPGASITTYCDERQLTIEERLSVFVDVCRAVQHAHHKGIIHRDLKPSNVLVMEQDGRPVPKVIDFGVAKAIGAGAESQERHTRAGALLGTPEYMSPEQAGWGSRDVDTRTDVYSLGVLLYELLSGELPIDSQTLRKAGLDAVYRVIREMDPPTPSSRISGTGSHLREIARARRVDPARLRKLLPGDLDWICLKSLEKDRDRRYATPTELAEDIRRFLGHEPVLAGRPSAFYRVTKFVRRHRTGVVAAGLIVVSLLAGTIGTALGFWNARQRVAEFNRLATVIRLRDAKIAAAELFDVPPWPEHAPAIATWLEDRGRPLEAALPELRAIVDATPGGLRNDSERFLHETLRGLLGELMAFVEAESGELPRLRARLAWACDVRRRSIDEPQARWNDPDLRIPPQLGLVPLGRDPASGLWEFVHLASGTPGFETPQRDPETGRLRITEDSGLVFVLLPAGRFQMGAVRGALGPNTDPDAIQDEGPVHEVTLAAFLLSKFEMTQAQWRRLSAGSNPSMFRPGMRAGDRDVTLACPVEQVSWLECEDLLRSLGLELPTEAQWEYACRAGSNTPWSWGAERTAQKDHGNVSELTAKRFQPGWPDRHIEKWDDGWMGPAVVGAFAPNALGLHDMHGNVAEWCRENFIPYGDETRAGDGLRSTQEAELSGKIVRGGAYNGPATETRSAKRRFLPGELRAEHVGVRPARALR